MTAYAVLVIKHLRYRVEGASSPEDAQALALLAAAGQTKRRGRASVTLEGRTVEAERAEPLTPRAVTP